MVEPAEILQLLILICYVARHTVQVDDLKVMFAGRVLGDVYVVHVQIRQTDVQCMNPVDERTNAGDNSFLLLSLQSVPFLADEIAQASGLQFLSDNKGFGLNAPCRLLAVAYGSVRTDAVVEKESCALPFVPTLGAGFADVSSGKNDVLKMRAEESLDEERLLL